MTSLQVIVGSIERLVRRRCGTVSTGRRRPGRAWAYETLEDRVVPATITVTGLGDSGDGTLRAAIEQANLDTAQDTIDFAPSVTGTINLSSALPDLSTNMILDGPGASVLTVARSGAAGTPKFRIFTVPGDVEVTISGLTISGGRGNAFIPSYPGASPLNIGGGIDNAGTLTVTDSTISGNSAADYGGGISNHGTLTVTDSTISNNTGNGGGGLENAGIMTVTNSTISGNVANFGGGIGGLFAQYVDPFPILRLFVTNCTISGNSAGMGGGVTGIGNTAGTITNTLISGNLGGEIFGLPAVTLSHDLISDTPDPLLGPLADNGGPTPTMALLPGSPAIDAGVPVDGVAADQRGVARPQGTAPDIGAFESRGFATSLVSGDGQKALFGSAFSQPLTVRITSSFGEPVAGGRVTFTAPASGASAALSTNPATIDANGLATVTATANDIAGSYTVTARATGMTSVPFALTNFGPLTVTGVVSVTHLRGGVSGIVLGFSEALSPDSATNRRSYSIAAGVKRRHKLVFSKHVKIRGVSYDDSAHQVTIRLARPIRRMVQVSVSGGIMAANGLSSQGGFAAVVS